MVLQLAAAARGGTLEVPLQFATIQAAVDAAQPWDLIRVAPGTYRENVVCGKGELFLTGEGATIDGRYLAPCLVIAGDWLDVSGFAFVNGRAAAPAGDGAGTAAGGGLVVTGEHINLRHLAVRACAGAGIECSGQILLDACVIDGCTGPGIAAVGTGSPAFNVLAIHCIVRRCSTGFAGLGGAFNVHDGTFELNRGAGIDCDFDSADWLTFNRFEDNTCVDNGGPGVRGLHPGGSQFGGYEVYRGNRLERNEVGLSFQGMELSADHLVVLDNRAGGIDLDAAELGLNHNTLRRNGGFGLRRADTFAVDPGSVGVLWNTVRDNAGDGLHLRGGSLALQGNRVRGNLGDGIFLDDAALPYFLDDNRVTRNGHDGIDNSAAGTWLVHNTSKGNGGADFAGLGDGSGDVDPDSFDNASGDGTGADSLQELDLDAAPGASATLRAPSDQFPTIQAALDAAVPGDVVVVAKGRHRENLSITTSGITLRGAGAIVDGGYAGGCLAIVADDVTVKGLTLVNGGAGGAADASAAGGVLVEGHGVRLRGLRVRACAGAGVALTGDGGSLRKLRVEGCDGGISASTVDPTGPGIEVLGCRVSRCGAGISGSGGPFDVRGNVVSGNRGDGIGLVLATQAGAATHSVRVAGNRCVGNAGRGIAVVDLSGAHPLVQDNVARGNEVGLDLALLAGSVGGNVVERNRSGGVLLAAASSEFLDNEVRDNGLVGVVLAGPPAPDGGSAGFNDLIGNDLSGNGGDGLELLCSGNDVRDNLIQENLGDGLQLDGGLTGCDVRDNSFLDNGHDGLDNSATGTVVRDNTCTGNGGADLAGIGAGKGSVDPQSSGNVTGDGTDLASVQELELDTAP